MKEKIIKTLILGFIMNGLLFGVLYLGISIGQGTFNFKEWAHEGRFLFAFVYIILAASSFVVSAALIHDKAFE